MVSLRDVLRIAGQADAVELSTLRVRIVELEADQTHLRMVVKHFGCKRSDCCIFPECECGREDEIFAALSGEREG